MSNKFLNPVVVGERGPAGPAGPAGAAGQTGATGPQGDPGISSSVFTYKFDTSTSGTPNSGYLRLNLGLAGHPESATAILVNHLDESGHDQDVLLQSVSTETQIIIQRANDSTIYYSYSVATIVSGAGFVTYTLEISTYTQGTIGNNDEVLLIFRLQGTPGATGASGPTGATGLTGATGSPSVTIIDDSTPSLTTVYSGTKSQALTDASNGRITTLETELDGTKVGIGSGAGATSQGVSAVAIGQSAAQTSQGDYAVAVGLFAGQNNQGIYSVAVGLNSGQTSQGQGCVALGLNAGQSGQGDNAVAIGRYAGQTSQSTNSIVINATAIWPLDTTYQSTQGLFINPVRNNNSSSTNVVCYNDTSKELTYYSSTNLSDLANATSSNTASTIVKRDASGNFSCGTITASGLGISGGLASQYLLANGGIFNSIKTFSPFGDITENTGVSNWNGSSYSVQLIYMRETITASSIIMYRNGTVSSTISLAIYDMTNTRIFNYSQNPVITTKYTIPILPNVVLTGGSYYYVGIFGTSAGMYSGTQAGVAIVNGDLHPNIQYARVSFTGTTLPTTLPTTGGSTSSVLYPPFTIIGY